MDKVTLKSIVVNLKDSGKSFTEISNILRDEYGIIKTRQAVCGLYNRAVNTKGDIQASDLVLASDVLNYLSLGKSINEIKGLIHDDKQVTSYKIDTIIASNSQTIKLLHIEKVQIVKSALKNGKDMEYLRRKLSYKTVEPSYNEIKSLIKEATTELMRESLIENAVRIIELTGDSTLAKNIVSCYNLSVTQKDISTEMNKI